MTRLSLRLLGVAYYLRSQVLLRSEVAHTLSLGRHVDLVPFIAV